MPESQSASWNFWRGTDLLLAHVIRVATGQAEEGQGAQAHCLIDIEVADDHEIFGGANEFLADVTEEALGKFRSIRLDVRAPDLHVELVMQWRRPWWHPGKKWYSSAPSSLDAEVSLRVSGRDAARVQASMHAVSSALTRGTQTGTTHQGLVAGVVSFLVTAAVGVVGILPYIFGLPLAVSAVISGVTLLPLFGVAMVCSAWVLPSLEVSRAGRTRLRKTLKVIGGPAAAIIVTGIGKFLFGG